MSVSVETSDSSRCGKEPFSSRFACLDHCYCIWLSAGTASYNITCISGTAFHVFSQEHLLFGEAFKAAPTSSVHCAGVANFE